MIPWAERLSEVSLTAATLYPELLEIRPELVPESVKNGCNVYSLCKMMKARTEGKTHTGK